MLVSTPVLTPTTYLRVVILGPNRTTIRYNNPFNLNPSNFETVELWNKRWVGRCIVTRLNNRLNSKVDRDTGEVWPAYVGADGIQAWHVNGKLHRDPIDGIGQPAYVWADNGTQEWWVYGRHHRLNGPA